ncbi:hypothetical protein MKW94_024705 [Papaver nudicaule]|uniref:Uncharacterized protein n=1 Tax=Papaver nudicaule TaxID=74823 RepID=A0AA41UYS3_PAPNU|nr:hypothetical protein [Papaver nudicaule]
MIEWRKENGTNTINEVSTSLECHRHPWNNGNTCGGGRLIHVCSEVSRSSRTKPARQITLPERKSNSVIDLSMPGNTKLISELLESKWTQRPGPKPNNCHS